MNSIPRQELDKVLRFQNIILGEVLMINDPKLCRLGSQPACEQFITSSDLFHFLEPTTGKASLEYFNQWHYETNYGDYNYIYDLSDSLGDGLCSYSTISPTEKLDELIIGGGLYVSERFWKREISHLARSLND